MPRKRKQAVPQKVVEDNRIMTEQDPVQHTSDETINLEISNVTSLHSKDIEQETYPVQNVSSIDQTEQSLDIDAEVERINTAITTGNIYTSVGESFYVVENMHIESVQHDNINETSLHGLCVSPKNLDIMMPVIKQEPMDNDFEKMESDTVQELESSRCLVKQETQYEILGTETLDDFEPNLNRDSAFMDGSESHLQEPFGSSEDITGIKVKGGPDDITSAMLQNADEEASFPHLSMTESSKDVKLDDTEGTSDSPSRHKRYDCEFCNRTFNMAPSLKRHQRAKHPFEYAIKPQSPKPAKPSQYTCQECGTKFTLEFNLQRHIRRIHSGEKRYNCSECGEKFLYLNELNLHMYTHKDHPFTCKYCDRGFHSSHEFLRHIKLHSQQEKGQENVFKCPLCGQKFTNVESCETHTKQHLVEDKYHCGECGQSFLRPEQLQVHKKLHQGTKPKICPFCKKVFQEHEDVQAHVDFHAHEMTKYKCKLCPKVFDEIVQLQHHMKTHAPPMHLVCKYCDKVFTDVPALLDHVKHKHTEVKEKPKPIAPKIQAMRKCPICDKIFFLTQAELMEHVNTHQNDNLNNDNTQTLKCYLCAQLFGDSVGLAEHLSSIHSIQLEADPNTNPENDSEFETNNLPDCSFKNPQLNLLPLKPVALASTDGFPVAGGHSVPVPINLFNNQSHMKAQRELESLNTS